jgi:hypothetical protein
LAPELISKEGLQEQDVAKRIDLVLKHADILGCKQFVTQKTIMEVPSSTQILINKRALGKLKSQFSVRGNSFP